MANANSPRLYYAKCGCAKQMGWDLHGWCFEHIGADHYALLASAIDDPDCRFCFDMPQADRYRWLASYQDAKELQRELASTSDLPPSGTVS